MSADQLDNKLAWPHCEAGDVSALPLPNCPLQVSRRRAKRGAPGAPGAALLAAQAPASGAPARRTYTAIDPGARRTATALANPAPPAQETTRLPGAKPEREPDPARSATAKCLPKSDAVS